MINVNLDDVIFDNEKLKNMKPDPIKGEKIGKKLIERSNNISFETLWINCF